MDGSLKYQTAQFLSSYYLCPIRCLSLCFITFGQERVTLGKNSLSCGGLKVKGMSNLNDLSLTFYYVKDQHSSLQSYPKVTSLIMCNKPVQGN